MKTEGHELTKDDFDNMCPCGKFTPTEEILHKCDCGWERLVMICDNCGEQCQVGERFPGIAPDNIFGTPWEKYTKGFIRTK